MDIKVRRFRSQLILIISISALSCSVSACGSSLGHILKNYGYTENRPASKLIAPGAVVFVDNEANGTLALICDQVGSLGGDFTAYSEIADVGEKLKTTAKLNLGADYLESLKANVRFSHLKDVELTFTKASVGSLTYQKVFENVGARAPACSQALRELAQAGKKIFMVRDVIRGDVEYKLTFDTELDIGVKAALTSELAAELNAEVSSAGESTLRGTGLHWGFKADSFLANVEPSTVASPQPSQPSRTNDLGDRTFKVDVSRVRR